MKEKYINGDIVKSNALIEAVYNPGSVYQMRLLMAALMQVKAKEITDPDIVYTVTANTLADITGTSARGNYQELKNAADDLLNTVVTIEDNPNGQRGRPSRTKINLVGACEYFDGEGKVELVFTKQILPYVSNLRKRFTQYQAKYVMPMRSSYGIRLYELCLQWLGDEREFEVQEFRRMFGLENKYKKLAEIKRRVIQPALDDINKHSDIRVDFGQRKSGRKVTHFQFMITRKAKTKKLTFNQFIEQHARPGESWEAAKNRLTKPYQEASPRYQK